MSEKQGYVYVLRLTGDKWYVGYSEDPQVRICSHFLGAGSKWTQTHKAIRTILVIRSPKKENIIY